MRWRNRDYDRARERLKTKMKWRRWFAWYPVTVEAVRAEGQRTNVWLERVDRRWYISRLTKNAWWEYRFPCNDTVD